MAVTIYVWPRDQDHVGHAALRIGTTYASFWPDDPAGKKDISTKRTHAARHSVSCERDCTLEGERQAGEILIHGLDETAMSLAWQNIKDQGLRFNLLRQNCSTVAATLLEIGSRRPPTFTPAVKISEWVVSPYKARVMTMMLIRSTVTAWSPEQVWRYGCELRACPGMKR